MLNWLDLIIAGIFVFSGVLSLLRGFVKEALSIVCWIGAFLAAIYGQALVAPYIEKWISDPQLLTLAASAIAFLIMLIFLSIVSYFISNLLVNHMISGVDRLLGLIFGLLRGALIVVALLFLIESIFPQLMEDEVWKQSIFVPYFIVFTHYFSDLFELTKQHIDINALPH